jgi:hypothetical protein
VSLVALFEVISAGYKLREASIERELQMTLEDALAVHIHLRDSEKISDREERALAVAEEIIDREARKAIAAVREDARGA